MAKTDRQTDKSTRWAFTAFEAHWNYFNDMNAIPSVKEWGWQTEICPETGRQHYQGYIMTDRQVRLSHWIKYMKGVHFEVCRNWTALVAYCKKTDSAVPGTQVNQVSTIEYWSMERSFCELMSYYSEYAEERYEHMDAIKDKKAYAKLEKTYIVDMYWYCVKKVVLKEPFRLSTFAQPQMEKTFCKTWELYKDPHFRALVLQPETQGDPLGPGPLRVALSLED